MFHFLFLLLLQYRANLLELYILHPILKFSSYWGSNPVSEA